MAAALLLPLILTCSVCDKVYKETSPLLSARKTLRHNFDSHMHYHKTHLRKKERRKPSTKQKQTGQQKADWQIRGSLTVLPCGRCCQREWPASLSAPDLKDIQYRARKAREFHWRYEKRKVLASLAAPLAAPLTAPLAAPHTASHAASHAASLAPSQKKHKPNALPASTAAPTSSSLLALTSDSPLVHRPPVKSKIRPALTLPTLPASSSLLALASNPSPFMLASVSSTFQDELLEIWKQTTQRQEKPTAPRDTGQFTERQLAKHFMEKEKAFTLASQAVVRKYTDELQRGVRLLDCCLEYEIAPHPTDCTFTRHLQTAREPTLWLTDVFRVYQKIRDHMKLYRMGTSMSEWNIDLEEEKTTNPKK